MAYGVKYRFEWTNLKGNACKIDILEDGYASSITSFNEVGNIPVSFQWDGDDDDKFKPICASEAKITLIKSDSFDIADFDVNSDFTYQVKIYYRGSLYWAGWLMLDDIQEAFEDGNGYLELRAVDGIALLKNKELKDKSGNRIWGAIKPITYIDYCLYYTGLDLAINTWVNIYPTGVSYNRSTTPSDEPFNLCSIYSWTFLKGKRNYEDCYTVLEKLMKGFKCRLFQYAGEWHIVRIEDYLFGSLDGSKFSSGAYTSSTMNKDWTHYVGKDRNTLFINNDHLHKRKRAIQKSRLTFAFRKPESLVRNQDFSEGTFNAILSTSSRRVYTVAGWTYPGTGTYDTLYYGEEIDANGYVKDSYAFFYSDNNNSTKFNSTSTTFPAKQGDRLRISYSFKDFVTEAAANFQRNQVKLVAGATTYYLRQDGTWGTNVTYIGYNGVTRFTVWRPFSIDTNYLPADGVVSIVLSNNGFKEGVNYEGYYKDLQIEYIGYAYDRIRAGGMEDIVEQTVDLPNTLDEQEDISNAIIPIVKGNLFNAAGTSLLPTWKHDGVSETLEFIRLSNYSYYRNYYRILTKIDGSFLNIGWYNSSNVYQAPLGLINIISFDAIANKKFLITRLGLELDSEQANISCVEIYDSGISDSTEDGDQQSNNFLDRDEDDVKFKRIRRNGALLRIFLKDTF